MRTWFPIAPLLAALLVTATAAAQQAGDPLRVLREMEIAGEAAFPRDRIAMALVRDSVTMRALQRPLDGEAAAEVAERVRELHRRGGYARATASGKVVAGVLRVALDAGTRYRCGEVRCSGNTTVATATLRERLAVRPRASVFASMMEKLDAQGAAHRAWVAGAFPVMDESAVSRATAMVREAYRAVGRHDALATVEFVPEGEHMALVITVTDEGREVRIRSLRLEGEDEVHATAVLAGLAFAADTVATSVVLAGLQRDLEATGRYLEVEVAVANDAPTLLDPLLIRVQARPGAPLPEAVKKRDVVQVSKAIEAVASRLERGDVVRVEVDFATTGSADWTRFRVMPGKFSLCAGLDGISIEVERLQWDERAPAKAMFGFTSDRLWYQLGEHAGSFGFPSPAGIQLQGTTRLLESGEMQLRWGVGFQSGQAAGQGETFALSIHPATAAQVLTKAREVRRDGDSLILQFGELALRIAASGELVGERFSFDVDGDAVELSWAPDGLPEARAPAAGAAAAVPALVTAASALVADLLPQTAHADVRVSALLRGCAQATQTMSPTTATWEREPPMPSVGAGPTSMMGVFGSLAALPAVSRQFRGHVAELGGAFASVMLGHGRAATSRFEAIADSERHGPLSLAIVAYIWDLLGNERAAGTFGRLAAERWSFDACYADAADIGANLEFVRDVPSRIGAAWRAQPELRELCAGLPEGAAGDLAAWRKGLELLWTVGAGDLLRRALPGK